MPETLKTACCHALAIPDRFWRPYLGGPARPLMCQACALPNPKLVLLR